MKTEYDQAKLYAIRRLAKQSLHSTALADALKKRLISQEVIDQLINDLTTMGFLNDAAWIASFVRIQTARKQGPRAIAQKLANKKIDRETIQEALEGITDESQQKQLIQQLVASRYKKYDLSDFKMKQKVVASLARRGFTISTILQVLGDSQFDEY